MIAALHLPPSLRAQIEREARATLPNECCGLIEGNIVGDVAHVVALHCMSNLSTDKDRFEIDPAEHIRLMRDLRGSARAIIGCYHSHPNGKAEPSAQDRAGSFAALRKTWRRSVRFFLKMAGSARWNCGKPHRLDRARTAPV
jgi:proteasome lid subunit RPN8/RPN11